MKSNVIEIVVSPTRQTRIETKGFTGDECRAASRFIEQALGKQTNEQLTAEYHELVSSRTQLEQGR